jgi:hypothetical protein
MNASNFIHAGYALLMMAIVWALTGNPLAGALLGVGFFAGREHSQAEYRSIQQFYDGKRANMPDWAGFMSRVWSKDSILDLMFPIVAVTVVLVILYFV